MITGCHWHKSPQISVFITNVQPTDLPTISPATSNGTSKQFYGQGLLCRFRAVAYVAYTYYLQVDVR